jgi:hypothetical protein
LKREAGSLKKETAGGRESGGKCADDNGAESVEYPAESLKVASEKVAPPPMELGATTSKRHISFSASSVELRALSDPPCLLES